MTGSRAPVALDLARILKVAGHNVICADSLYPTISKFSSYVDAHYKLPSPVTKLDRFALEIEKIVQEEKIDLLIPMCEEVVFISKIRLQLSCDVFTMDFSTIEALHNKWSFYRWVKNFSIQPPKTWLIQNEQDLVNLPANSKLVFKRIYSRFSAHLIVKEKEEKLPSLLHDPKNPYIAQEYIEGEKLCSYSVVREGKVTAHSEYKALQSIGRGSAIAFVSTYSEKVFSFVCDFVKKINYTGQISFDFIRKNNGELYCIECNPRATSGIHLFEKNSDLSNSFVGQKVGCNFAKLGLYKRELLFSLWYGLKQGDISFSDFSKILFKGKSPLFWSKDIKPFLWMPYLLFHITKMTVAQKKGFHEVMSRDLEYNGELLCEC